MWDSVKRILCAYAAYDGATGYVQSMNFQAAFLLLAGVGEEDAFWCLVALVSKVVPGYFAEGMAAAKLDARVFGHVLHQHLPALALHLAELSSQAGEELLITGIIASQWLLTLFVNVLPLRCALAVWDELTAVRHRAPLFAAALSLLSAVEEQVCATADMGEALELLQAVGHCILDGNDAACDAFEHRMRDLARGPLSPDALGAACARELGEGGPEAGLGSFLTGGRLAAKAPAGISAGYAAATDTSELLRGTKSGGLYPIAQGRDEDSSAATPGGEGPDAGLQAEIAAVQCLEVGTPRAGGAAASGLSSALGSSHGAGGALTQEDVLLISDYLLQLDKLLCREGYSWLRTAARDGVRSRVLRPLGALAGARLGRASSDWQHAHRLWCDQLHNVIAAPPLGTLDTRRATYLLMWEHSACEAALTDAEVLLERLARLRASWKQLAHALASDAPMPGTPGSAGAIALGSAGTGILDPLALGLEVSPASVQALAATSRAQAQTAFDSLRDLLAKRMQAASEDLPLLDANEADAQAYLQRRAQAAEAGLSTWLRLWDSRRSADADSAADALLASAAAAADALQSDQPDQSAGPPAPEPPGAGDGGHALSEDVHALAAGCAAAFEAEKRRCAAAVEALVAAHRALVRRQERLSRETVLVRAVTARAHNRCADVQRRAQALRRSATRCQQHLGALIAPTAPAAADEVMARLLALYDISSAAVTTALADSARFITEASNAVHLSTVSLVDRGVVELQAVSEQVLLALRAEREREATKVHLGREMLSAVGTLSKAVNNAASAAAAAAAGSSAPVDSDDDAVGAAASGRAPAPRGGASLFTSALRRGLRDVAAAARGSIPSDSGGGDTHVPDSPVRPAAQAPQEGGLLSPAPLHLAGEEDMPLDAEGRPRRKGRAEKALEEELRALNERRARMLERKEALERTLGSLCSTAMTGASVEATAGSMPSLTL